MSCKITCKQSKSTIDCNICNPNVRRGTWFCSTYKTNLKYHYDISKGTEYLTGEIDMIKK